MTGSPRPFGFWTATALVVGGMVGAGIFVLPAQLAPYGDTGVAAWLLAIGGALIIAGVLVRLAAVFPEATGIVAICGIALGPLAGVLFGWSYWISVWCANAVLALTAAQYLAVFWPPAAASPLAAALTGTATIALLTAINLCGARAAGRVQTAVTAAKLLPLAAVAGLLLVLGVRGGWHPDGGRAGFSAGALTPAITLAFYALIGFESASVAAERVRDPARNVARATLTGLAVAGLLSLAISVGIAATLPAERVAASPAPVALFVETFWGRAAGLAVAASALVAVVGCINGWVLLQGEVPLGMARAGLMPAWFARTDRRDVPVAVLLVSSALASLLLLGSATRSLGGMMAFMLNLTSAATLWIYVGACLAALVSGVARAPAALGLATAGWMLAGSGLQAVALSIVLMLTALPAYLRRSRAPTPAAP